MHFGFIVNIILFKYLQSSDRTKSEYPHFEKYFKHGVNISIVLMVLYFSITPMRGVFIWISNIANLGLAYLAYNRTEFKPIKVYVKAFLPLLLVTIIKDILDNFSGSFVENIHSYFDTASFFAFAWLIAMWFFTRRQQNALIAEKQKTLEQELEIQKSVEMKQLLEKQVVERTSKITAQKEELQMALQNLKETQSQLIHAEKMASLGELTAGIAHEIQNPLNFVNNFSELSTELLDEVNDELSKGNQKDAIEIITDLKQNLQKINHHGSRASSIVKGMLDHSRASSDDKVPTDINALCDEYMRLSFHGLRAKDKSFNSSFKLDLQENLPLVNIVSQDIGRVLLNILNNAFYTVNRKKINSKDLEYNPLVTLSTKIIEDQIVIKIVDNGEGMDKTQLDKIFQPFFTTKPTGEGTGLGMSLSYDIITKGHGGKISVKSKVGEGSVFSVSIPLT